MTAPVVPYGCSVADCPQPPGIAMRFRSQYGHVHYCPAHGAEVREWYDVIESNPLPCPYHHGDGSTWIDYPPPGADMSRGWSSQELPVICDDDNLWTVADAARALGTLPGDPENVTSLATVAKLRDLTRYHHITPVGKRRATRNGQSGRYARVYRAIDFIKLYEQLGRRSDIAA